MSVPQPFRKLDNECCRSTANASNCPRDGSATNAAAPTAESRQFGAEILLKRVGKWIDVKAILLDRKPCWNFIPSIYR
jgi:hypothetical protein